MPISWNEIRSRAITFSNEWKAAEREHAEAKSFWDAFFHVFGISRRRIAKFEHNVKKLNQRQGFIDLFWKGVLVVEHKSKGKDLDKAYTQALSYFEGLTESELPRYVLVSDFERFRLFDLDENTKHEFSLSEFSNHIHLFGFVAGYQQRTYKEEDPVNIEAAELMGKLHDRLKAVGYTGHDLEVYLVRLLFCLFAEDTGIFEKDIFYDYLETHTKTDGSDLAMHLAQLFQTLDTPKENRLSNIDESQNQFPYVNGLLFTENLRFAAFDSSMRTILLEACALDWGQISPAIFGSMFQAAMDATERRNLGAHFTSEKNIQKLIAPLFLEKLKTEFEKAKGNTSKLLAFQEKLATLTFFDPACGSGNFLIITYRELRELEIKVLEELLFVQQKRKREDLLQYNIKIELLVKINVNQFYGIEIDEFAAQIAQVGMWLIDHQMNLKVSEKFGQYFVRLPLKEAATIVHGNSLRIDWETVVPKKKLSYILGNPPFIGHQWRNKEQQEDMHQIFGKIKRTGRLDYVCAWFYKAGLLMKGTKIRTAFVTTNSIIQGEQVPIIWKELIFHQNNSIDFAHQTFQWNYEEKIKGKAAVHVVIIGFSSVGTSNKRLYTYEDIKGKPTETKVEKINPYLVEGNPIFIKSRGKPIHGYPKLYKGSQPTDGGYLIFKPKEKEEFEHLEPKAKTYLRPYIGGAELMRGTIRYCLWLKDCSPNQLKKMKYVLQRLEGVKQARLKSKTKSVQEFAKYPYLFTQDRQPNSDYLAMPRVSSERRFYIPIAYLNKNIIAHEKLLIIPNASIYLFGILMSNMHNTWTRLTSGRMKSDISYSPAIYNNYPFPKEPSSKNRKKVEKAAQKVLDVRATFPNSSLADLYDPLTMPPKLVKAHQALDKAVDLCYRPQRFTNERNRIEFLFNLYEVYTAPLMAGRKRK